MAFAMWRVVPRNWVLPAFSLLVSTQASVAWAQEPPPYLGHPETLNAPEPEETSTADAEREEPIGERFDFDQKPLLIGGMVGFGTPVGLIGAVGMYTPATPVSVGIGGGTNAYGLQLTAMATLRPFSWARRNAAHAISLTPAWSTGPWKSLDLYFVIGLEGPEERANDAHWAADRAHWFQVDVSYELLTRRGFWLRAGYGVGWMLNPGDAHCELLDTGARTSCEGHDIKGESPDVPIFTLSIVLGYAIDI